MRALSVLVCGSMLVAAMPAEARRPETRFTIEVNQLVDAFWAENAICRDYPGGNWLGDSACARREEIASYLERKHYCFDSKEKISAFDNWLWCGKGRAPKD